MLPSKTRIGLSRTRIEKNVHWIWKLGEEIRNLSVVTHNLVILLNVVGRTKVQILKQLFGLVSTLVCH